MRCGAFGSPQLWHAPGMASNCVRILAARCMRERDWDLRLFGTGMSELQKFGYYLVFNFANGLKLAVAMSLSVFLMAVWHAIEPFSSAQCG